MDESPRVIDLVPRRLSSHILLFLAGLAILVGLEVLYAWSAGSKFAGLTTDGRIAAFDLDGEGSLAVWFSSATLSLAGLVSLLIYAVRRHRKDDYQGYYRIWFWAAMCWFVMSIDETSSLHEGFMAMMDHVAMANMSDTPVNGDGSMWWVVPYFFVLGAVGSRVFLDMRSCGISAAAFLMTAVCYVVAVGMQLFSDGLVRAVMIEEGAEMLGNLFLLLAMGLHARHVILDAQGLLPEKAEKRTWRLIPAKEAQASHEAEEVDEVDEEEKELEEENASDEWIKVDSAHTTPQPVLKRKAKTSARTKKKTSVKASAAAADPVQEAAPVKRKLTKQERKALRKRLERERLQRERSQKKAW